MGRMLTDLGKPINGWISIWPFLFTYDIIVKSNRERTDKKMKLKNFNKKIWALAALIVIISMILSTFIFAF